jgi:hypothetical protein
VAIGFGDEVYLSEDEGVSWRAQEISGAIRAVRFGEN